MYSHIIKNHEFSKIAAHTKEHIREGIMKIIKREKKRQRQGSYPSNLRSGQAGGQTTAVGRQF